MDLVDHFIGFELCKPMLFTVTVWNPIAVVVAVPDCGKLATYVFS